MSDIAKRHDQDPKRDVTSSVPIREANPLPQEMRELARQLEQEGRVHDGMLVMIAATQLEEYYKQERN